MSKAFPFTCKSGFLRYGQGQCYSKVAIAVTGPSKATLPPAVWAGAGEQLACQPVGQSSSYKPCATKLETHSKRCTLLGCFARVITEGFSVTRRHEVVIEFLDCTV